MGGPSPSLADHVCLAVVAEGPTHGWALVKLLAPDGDIGRIWALSRPLTYRSVDRLAEAGLIEREDAGRRTELRVTGRGRAATTRWLGSPVEHLRDLRTEFLLKITLHRRLGTPVDQLVAAQRTALAPAIEALTEKAPDDAVELWRHESALAARRFLDRLAGDIVSAP